MKKSELELIIKRLNKDLGYNKDEIKQWLTNPCFSHSNSTPIKYLNAGLFYFIISRIDTMVENLELYK